MIGRPDEACLAQEYDKVIEILEKMQKFIAQTGRPCHLIIAEGPTKNL